jgi:hypothetical protein
MPVLDDGGILGCLMCVVLTCVILILVQSVHLNIAVKYRDSCVWPGISNELAGLLQRAGIHSTVVFSLKTPRPIRSSDTTNPIVALLAPLLDRVLSVDISPFAATLNGVLYVLILCLIAHTTTGTMVAVARTLVEAPPHSDESSGWSRGDVLAGDPRNGGSPATYEGDDYVNQNHNAASSAMQFDDGMWSLFFRICGLALTRLSVSCPSL